MLMADEQFYLSLLSSDSFWSEMTFYFMKEIFAIFALFASIYILWKVIMNMPEFVFKLVGLDKLDNTSQFASSMQQNFGKYGFQA
jgi:hypothetical protein